MNGLTSQDVLGELTTVAWQFAGTVFSISVLSTLVLFGIFEFGWRTSLSRRITNKWLKERCGTLGYPFEKVKEQLLSMVSHGNEQVFYDLSPKRLCGQLAAALQIDLRRLRGREPLVVALFSGVKSDDVDFFNKGLLQEYDKDEWRKKFGDEELVEFNMEQGIDEFQLVLEERSKKETFIWSVILSYIIVSTLLITPNVLSINSSGFYLYSVVIIFSTFLSTFFKQLIDTLIYR